MPNNVAIGPNGVVAKQTISFADAGINSGNTAIIYKVGNPNQSFVPGRSINPITGFVADAGYYMVMLAAMDLSAYVVPPIGAPSAVQMFVDHFDGANALYTAHTPNIGTKTSTGALRIQGGKLYNDSGSGNINFTSPTVGSLPPNRKVVAVFSALSAAGFSVVFSSNGSGTYEYVGIADDGAGGFNLVIGGSAGPALDVAANLAGDYPITFTAQLVDGVLSGSIESGEVTYTSLVTNTVNNAVGFDGAISCDDLIFESVV